jgi:AcrR family transcriptional regulator
MKRIVKAPDVRRMEIIQAAEFLFEKKGYSKTPVESIIKKAGIAKGTFYYYFKSKEDILRALVEKTGTEIAAHFASIVDTANLSALDKLKLMFRGKEKTAKTKTEIMKVIHKPENRELQEQLNIYTIECVAPLIAKVLEQGHSEKIFQNKVSTESLQIMLAGSLFVLDSGLFTLNKDQRNQYLLSLQKMFEMIVGAKSGSLGFIAKEN